MYVVAVAVVLVVAAAAAVLLLRNRSNTPGGEPLGPGEFTATSPWRLVIRDNISGMDNGCDVTVTKIDNGEQQAVFIDIYVSKSFQIRETGTFRWTANNPGCLVIQRSGAGKTALPFAHDSGGDADAFDAGGPVAIEVVNFNGNSECKFVLHDASDGRQLDFGSVPKGGGPLSLNPAGRSPVYVANPYCGARISAG